MNSTIKLIRKFCTILIFSIFLGILLNLLFLAIVTWNRQDNNSSGWKQAEEIAAALTLSENGGLYPFRRGGESTGTDPEPGESWWRMIQGM